MNSDRVQMLAGTGADERVLDVGGTATSILEAGTGEPLVLLHGGIECGGIMWTPVIPALAGHHRVIAPDVPGLGESAPVRHLDQGAFDAWLEQVLDATDATGGSVVAHSLVGSLAARFAATHPQRLARLVVYAAPGIGPYRMPWRLRYVAVRFALRPTPANAERFDRFALLDLEATKRRDPAWYTTFERYTRERASERHVKRTMNRLVSTQTKPIPLSTLDDIKVPVTLVWGRGDRMVPLSTGSAAAEHHRWPLHVIDGAAHAPHIEQPERFVGVIDTVTGCRRAGGHRHSAQG